MSAWRRALLGSVLLALAVRALPVAAADGTRTRQLVAVVALNDGTEITDFLVPFGTLAAADVADVVAVAAETGPAGCSRQDACRSRRRWTASTATTPAAPTTSSCRRCIAATTRSCWGWLRRQAALAATVVGIRDGVRMLARAGLLDGRWATDDWYSLPSLRRTFPGVHWVEGRRFVRDGSRS
jgi:transcriptional regulator GlxA family with amidase domain